TIEKLLLHTVIGDHQHSRRQVLDISPHPLIGYLGLRTMQELHMSDPEIVISVLTNPIHSSLQLILEHYQNIREQGGRFGSAHPLWGFYRALGRSLASSDPVQRRQPHLDVTWSLGQGQWASIPWAACYDRRDTTTTQRSIYVVYLFREDMSGVYLTLNQGV